jgi:hypothetical protein
MSEAGFAAKPLTEGWRELLVRGGGALTHFGTEESGKDESAQEFPRWSLLAAETWETALDDGVLTVILPKTDTLPPRRLTVSD